MKNAKKPNEKDKKAAAKGADKNKKGKQDDEPEIDDSGPHIFKILSEEVKKITFQQIK